MEANSPHSTGERCHEQDGNGFDQSTQSTGSPTGEHSSLSTRLRASVHHLVSSAVSQPRHRSTVASANVAAGFIAGSEPETLADMGAEGNVRHCVHRVMTTTTVECFLHSVVVADFIFTCLDADLRAGGNSTPGWLGLLSQMFLALYIVEFCLALFVKRGRVFREVAQRLDFAIIIASLLGILIGNATLNLSALRIVRLLRAVRMVRLLRKFGQVKELKRLLQMTANCLRTLCWSICFLSIVMTMWAVVAVETIHPLIQLLEASGTWDECAECLDAYSSVMLANLTMVRTIIAGDSWGDLAIPVIRAFPVSAIFFIGSLMTIVYGVLNLIVAVMVDTFAEQRQKDETSLAKEMEEDLEQDVEFFETVFSRLDEDQSGDITLPELVRGAETIAEFRSRLRVLDIDEDDLVHLFGMLDSDRSGSIDLNEFVYTLSRWRHESKTASRFVKYSLIHAMVAQEQMSRKIEILGERFEDLQNNQCFNTSGQVVERVSAAAPAEGHPFPHGAQTDEETNGMSRLKESVHAHQQNLSSILLMMSDLGRKAEMEHAKLVADSMAAVSNHTAPPDICASNLFSRREGQPASGGAASACSTMASDGRLLASPEASPDVFEALPGDGDSKVDKDLRVIV